AFQLITQVSGRSGRKHDRGQVIVQTNQPDHPLLLQIKEGHLDLFYGQELAERQKFKYPPFYRLIKIIIKGKDKNLTHQAANDFILINMIG
ncbi:primosomal protein N', partial [Cyclobacteriaceae bacterium]|nr:primosomal protein N' [Cyclobacteriaceae bacterium]